MKYATLLQSGRSETRARISELKEGLNPIFSSRLRMLVSRGRARMAHNLRAGMSGIRGGLRLSCIALTNRAQRYTLKGMAADKLHRNPNASTIKALKYSSISPASNFLAGSQRQASYTPSFCSEQSDPFARLSDRKLIPSYSPGNSGYSAASNGRFFAPSGVFHRFCGQILISPLRG